MKTINEFAEFFEALTSKTKVRCLMSGERVEFGETELVMESIIMDKDISLIQKVDLIFHYRGGQDTAGKSVIDGKTAAHFLDVAKMISDLKEISGGGE